MMADNTPSQARTIKEYMRDRARDMRVALPGRVEVYYPGTETTRATADIQPLLKETMPGEDPVALPVLPRVPIVFPSSSLYALQFPLVPGDNVLLVFIDKSIDKWNATGGVVDPQDTRQHDLSDAVAIPGLAPEVVPRQPATLEGSASFSYRDATGLISAYIQIKPDGDIIVTNSDGAKIRLGSPTASSATVPQEALNTWVVDLMNDTVKKLVEDISDFLIIVASAAGVDSTDFVAKIALLIIEIERMRDKFAADPITQAGYGVRNTKVLIGS